MPVLFHRLAISELSGGFRWYARRSPRTAVRFRSAVDTALALVEANPGIGTPCFGPYRWVAVRRFSYLIYYRELTTALIVVYALAHSHRRPGYWLRRTAHP